MLMQECTTGADLGGGAPSKAAAPISVQQLLEGLGPEVAATVEEAGDSVLLNLVQLEARVSDECARQTREAVASGAGPFSSRSKQASELVECSNCGAQVTVNRFAPHLEKCMLGKGRASARAARDSMMRQSAAENGEMR